MAAKSAAQLRHGVADDGDGRQVGRTQAHRLRLAQVANLHRLEAHQRRSHRVDRDGIIARDHRAQRHAAAIPWTLALHAREAVNQAEPGQEQTGQLYQAIRGPLNQSSIRRSRLVGRIPPATDRTESQARTSQPRHGWTIPRSLAIHRQEREARVRAASPPSLDPPGERCP